VTRKKKGKEIKRLTDAAGHTDKNWYPEKISFHIPRFGSFYIAWMGSTTWQKMPRCKGLL
jgi:hypothetical protein